jgi:hypothetical protein
MEDDAVQLSPYYDNTHRFGAIPLEAQDTMKQLSEAAWEGFYAGLQAECLDTYLSFQVLTPPQLCQPVTIGTLGALHEGFSNSEA